MLSLRGIPLSVHVLCKCSEFTQSWLLSHPSSLVCLKNCTHSFHRHHPGGNWVLPSFVPMQVLIRKSRAWKERAGPACPKDWSAVGREEAVHVSLLFRMWVGKSCCCLAEDKFLMCFWQGRFDSWAGSWVLVCAVCQVLLQKKVGWGNLEWVFSIKYISQMDTWQCALTLNSLYVKGNREEKRNRADRKSSPRNTSWLSH